MTYITHGNYKGTRWYPRCCCEDCEVIRERFTRFDPIDTTRWEEIRGSWSTHSDPRSTADGRQPLRESGGSLPALVVGVQELPDAEPDFYTVTDVTIKSGAQPIFIVDFTDAITDTYHAVMVTYDKAINDQLVVSFRSYSGTTATSLGGNHIIQWDPADPGEFLRATFTVCLNDDNLSIQMVSGTTGAANDATGKDSPPDFFLAEDISAKHGGQRAGFGFGGGLSSPRQGTRWNSFELHIHENQKSGCPACLSCDCTGAPSDEYEVEIVGIDDVSNNCCDNCDDLNQIFTLRYSPALSNSQVCVWDYNVGSGSQLWTCNYPYGSPCGQIGPFDVDVLRLSVMAGEDDAGNPICIWKFAFVVLSGAGSGQPYFGHQWDHRPSSPCTCDLSTVFDAAGHPAGSAAAGTAPYPGATGETILDSEGNPQMRLPPGTPPSLGGRFFSDVCDISAATVTITAA
jgi:hypothetical protein